MGRRMEAGKDTSRHDGRITGDNMMVEGGSERASLHSDRSESVYIDGVEKST